MNIFEQYSNKIKGILLDLSKNGDLILPDSLEGITTELPPSKFTSDISTNVAMVLSKVNTKEFRITPSNLSKLVVCRTHSFYEIYQRVNSRR